MAYGNSTPPEGAPVPPQELIGAALFLGLVSVVSISIHGAYLIALPLGRTAFDPGQLTLIVVNAAGFAASLWLLALRRWAWQTAIAYSVVEIGLRAYNALGYLAPQFSSRANPRFDLPAAVGEALLALVLLVVMAYLLGADTRAILDERQRYRSRQEA